MNEINKIIKEQTKQAHLYWLKRAKTMKDHGIELTVLPYGFLSQAVGRAVRESFIGFIGLEIVRIESRKLGIPRVTKNHPYYQRWCEDNEVFDCALEEEIAHYKQLLSKLK